MALHVVRPSLMTADMSSPLPPRFDAASFNTGASGDEAREPMVPVSSHRAPTTSEHVAIGLAVFMPCFVSLLLCSRMGLGCSFFNWVAGHASLSGGLAALIVFLLVLFTILRVRSKWGLLIWLLVLMICALNGPRHPWLPTILTPLHQCVILGVLRVLYGFEVGRRRFYTSVFVTFGITSALILGASILWSIAVEPDSKDVYFNAASQKRLAEEIPSIYATLYKERPLNYTSDCGIAANLSNETMRDKEHIEFACEQALSVMAMVWHAPATISFFNVGIAVFVLLFGVMLDTNNSDHLEWIMKWYIVTITVLVAGLAISFMISSGANGVHTGGLLKAMFSIALIVCVVWLYHELGQEKLATILKHKVDESKLLSLIWEQSSNEWIQAAMLIPVSMTLMLIGAFFGFTHCLHRVSDHLGIMHQAQPMRSVKTAAHRFSGGLLAAIGSWHCVSLLQKICMLGELFFIFSVGVSKLTPVFLSWLNEQLANSNIWIVVIVVSIVGFLMFLLPPVPGIPVFIFNGVVLGGIGMRPQNAWLGFPGGVILSIVVSFCVKLAASTGQYYIGYFLGRSVKIQQAVGVTTLEIRAVEHFLASPGLSYGKSLILTAGPDWPTSVLCGILRVDIPQMLLGTCPVIFIITPCVMAGAFTTMTKPGVETGYDLWVTILTALAAGVLMLAAAATMLLLANVINTHGEELEAFREDHRAVVELTAQEEEYNSMYRQVVSWGQINTLRKAVIVFAAGSMCISVSALAVLSNIIFNDFDVSGKIRDPLTHGGLDDNWLNIVEGSFGWVIIGLFAIAVIFHVIFVCDTQLMAQARWRRQTQQKGIEMEELAKPAVDQLLQVLAVDCPVQDELLAAIDLDRLQPAARGSLGILGTPAGRASWPARDSMTEVGTIRVEDTLRVEDPRQPSWGPRTTANTLMPKE